MILRCAKYDKTKTIFLSSIDFDSEDEVLEYLNYILGPTPRVRIQIKKKILDNHFPVEFTAVTPGALAKFGSSLSDENTYIIDRIE